MSQAAHGATRERLTRGRALALTLLAALTLALTPSLVLVGEGSSAVSVAVVGLLVAALTPTAGRGLVLLPAVGLARPATTRPVPSPPSHVTDPVHPRRPRAPGHR